LVCSGAGARGPPPLQPTGYLKNAVYFDGDGRRDIWNSVPDTLATIANFFSRNGWRGTEPWGTEVALPRADYCVLEGPTQGQTAAAWQEMGFRPVTGAPAIGGSLATRFLLAPGGALGPTFLVSENFYVIKEYNFSDLYALFVAHLADRIAGNDRAFVTPWQPIDRIDHGQIQRMQLGLIGRGYDVGGADGLVGYRTRISVGRFQAGAGVPVTCFPNAATIAAAA
jgi:membrane-bound lytic murein transglycosylase B